MTGVAPNQGATWSRRDVWIRKLLYPGHTLPTAAAPVLVAVGLAIHDETFACYGVALLAGAYLLSVAGPFVLLIGLLSIGASWVYSAGPWPVGKHGLADPLFFLFFGYLWLALDFGGGIFLPLLTLPYAIGLCRRVLTLDRYEDLVPMTPCRLSGDFRRGATRGTWRRARRVSIAARR